MTARDVLPPDEVLVAGLRAGDERVFATLVDGWSASMLRLARSFVGSTATAEDVVQDTWIAVIRGINGFERRSALRTWVYRILVNTAKKRGARESRTVPWTTAAEVHPEWFRGPDDAYPGGWREFPDDWPSVESDVLAGEVRATVARLLDELPLRQRVVLTLRDVEGCDADEVCALLDISAGNQRVLLHRARSAVRAGLADYFATDRDLA